MSVESVQSMECELPIPSLDSDVANQIIIEILGNEAPLRSPGNYLDDGTEPLTFDDLFNTIGFDTQIPLTPTIDQMAEAGNFAASCSNGYPRNTQEQPQASQQPIDTATRPSHQPAFPLDARWTDCHKMHLRAFYQNLFIGDAGKGVDIDQVGGAFIYHQKVQGIPKFLPGDVAPILLPELPPETAKKLEKSEKATRMTATVLADMTGGLLVQYHDGALWVKRHCVSRVFYWTQQLNSTQSVKLDRDKPTKVFDFRAYFDRLQQLATTGYYDFSQEKRPVVVFTFGQQWNGSSSNLKDMYVRIEITPLKAKEELNRVSRGAWDHQSIAVSISEEDIERSENGSVIMAPNLMLQGQYQHEPMSQ